MMVNILPFCLAEADFKQTNDSFWKIKNLMYRVSSARFALIYVHQCIFILHAMFVFRFHISS